MLSGIFEQTNECVIMDEVRKGKLLECGRIMHWLILLELKRKETGEFRARKYSKVHMGGSNK